MCRGDASAASSCCPSTARLSFVVTGAGTAERVGRALESTLLGSMTLPLPLLWASLFCSWCCCDSSLLASAEFDDMLADRAGVLFRLVGALLQETLNRQFEPPLGIMKRKRRDLLRIIYGTSGTCACGEERDLVLVVRSAGPCLVGCSLRMPWWGSQG